MSLFSRFEDEDSPKADVFKLREFLGAKPCKDCNLGLVQHPNNPGIISGGNISARLAIVGDVPSVPDMLARKAFAGKHGVAIGKWIRWAQVPPNDYFLVYTVQCPTPVEEKTADGEEPEQRAADKTEIAACFPNRCLRILRAMPNLKVVWAVGLNTAKVLLGGDPSITSHIGQWFGADLLPGVAVFCLPHPRDFDVRGSDMKRGWLRQQLTCFRNEFYGWIDEKAAAVLVPPEKIVNILAQRTEERRAE